jgi:general secretion pathway protein D
VKMQIFQEISSVQASSINSATGLITNKRSFETNVLVEDGGIIVLGGLLSDEYAGNTEKVPLLGDIPGVGNLFRTETRSRKKTNLMVFLRPVVLRDAAQSEALSLDRYDLLRGKQGTAQPVPSVVVPVNEGPVLPAPVRSAPAIPVPAPLGQPATPAPVR